MNHADATNALFELAGAVLTWRNALQLHRDQEIKGVYWPVTGFFAAWGAWNLYYYPSLGQTLSFAAGALLFAGNCAWVVMALRLRARRTS